MNQTDLMRQIGEKANALLEKYEYLLALLALLATILYYLNILSAEVLLIPVFSIYALVIFFCAYIPVLPDEESQPARPELLGFTNFIYKLMCLSCSVGLLAILFTLSHWPGGEMMGNLSISSCGICLVGMLILQFGFNVKSKAFDSRHYYRLAILLVFSLYFMIERVQLFG
jgi:hypothetical protein